MKPPEPMDPEKVEEITEAARQFYEAWNEAAVETTLELSTEAKTVVEAKRMAMEFNKVRRDQEDIAIAELAKKLGERHSAVARVFRNFVPF